jgi:hypothetical protein
VLHVLHIAISVSSKAPPDFLFVSAASPTPEESVCGLSWGSFLFLELNLPFERRVSEPILASGVITNAIITAECLPVNVLGQLTRYSC